MYRKYLRGVMPKAYLPCNILHEYMVSLAKDTILPLLCIVGISVSLRNVNFQPFLGMTYFLTIITVVPNLIMHRSRVLSQVRLGFSGGIAAGALKSQAFMDGLHVCFERIGPRG